MRGCQRRWRFHVRCARRLIRQIAEAACLVALEWRESMLRKLEEEERERKVRELMEAKQREEEEQRLQCRGYERMDHLYAMWKEVVGITDNPCSDVASKKVLSNMSQAEDVAARHESRVSHYLQKLNDKKVIAAVPSDDPFSLEQFVSKYETDAKQSNRTTDKKRDLLQIAQYEKSAPPTVSDIDANTDDSICRKFPDAAPPCVPKYSNKGDIYYDDWIADEFTTEHDSSGVLRRESDRDKRLQGAKDRLKQNKVSARNRCIVCRHSVCRCRGAAPVDMTISCQSYIIDNDAAVSGDRDTVSARPVECEAAKLEFYDDYDLELQRFFDRMEKQSRSKTLRNSGHSKSRMPNTDPSTPRGSHRGGNASRGSSRNRRTRRTQVAASQDTTMPANTPSEYARPPSETWGSAKVDRYCDERLQLLDSLEFKTLNRENTHDHDIERAGNVIPGKSSFPVSAEVISTDDASDNLGHLESSYDYVGNDCNGIMAAFSPVPTDMLETGRKRNDALRLHSAGVERVKGTMREHRQTVSQKTPLRQDSRGGHCSGSGEVSWADGWGEEQVTEEMIRATHSGGNNSTLNARVLDTYGRRYCDNFDTGEDEEDLYNRSDPYELFVFDMSATRQEATTSHKSIKRSQSGGCSRNITARSRPKSASGRKGRHRTGSTRLR